MEHYRKSSHCTYDIKYHISMANKIPETSAERSNSRTYPGIDKDDMFNE